MRTIAWSHEATRQFLALSSQDQDKIEAKIVLLATNPAALANQIKALKGVKAYRLRGWRLSCHLHRGWRNLDDPADRPSQ